MTDTLIMSSKEKMQLNQNRTLKLKNTLWQQQKAESIFMGSMVWHKARLKKGKPSKPNLA